jgi:MtN3 and saliva related transmembrane protein
MITMTDVVGYMAAFVGTFLMVPQLVRALKTKHMGDISATMLWAYVLNCVLWSAYGILLWALPLMICNLIALGIAIWQVVLKKKYG